MSLKILLEKYDLSSEDELQKALAELGEEEAEVEQALTNAASRACALGGKMRAASQAYTKLGSVHVDAENAASMVSVTAELARDVSAKVRQLDLARSRVVECQRRVLDLIDLQICSAGVEAAIRAHDYETGAAHVARFLSMDPGSVAAARARGTPDPRDAMSRAANTLRDNLIKKFEEAAKREDDVSVEKLFRLFPQLGRADEGVELLAKYLANQVLGSSRRCLNVDASGNGAVFADAFTRLLETVGGAVERTRAMCTNAGISGLLIVALKTIQPTVCLSARKLASELFSARKLPSAPADPRTYHQHSPDPLALEPTIAELALVHSRIQLYFAFIRRKSDMDTASLDENAREVAMLALNQLLAECDLTRTAHDILAQYLILERYFLEESVTKALRMAAPHSGAKSSSLVDDVFFITRKCIRRSISSSSVDGACAVLNDAATQLEREVAGALRRWLRSPPQDPLPFPMPPSYQSPLDLPTALGTRLNRDIDAQRQLFLSHANEAESGAEWSEQLAGEACNEAEIIVARSSGDRAKLQSCAGGLASAAATFRAAHDLALTGIRAAMRLAVAAWAETLITPDHDTTEDVGIDALQSALDELANSARTELSQRAADSLLAAIVSDIAVKAEKQILTNTYSREGGMCVERRARRLASWAGGCAGGARERCARFTQAAALLALERPTHAHDALLPAPRLSPNDVRNILACRSDFKFEEIKRLKL